MTGRAVGRVVAPRLGEDQPVGAEAVRLRVVPVHPQPVVRADTVPAGSGCDPVQDGPLLVVSASEAREGVLEGELGQAEPTNAVPFARAGQPGRGGQGCTD